MRRRRMVFVKATEEEVMEKGRIALELWRGI